MPLSVQQFIENLSQTGLMSAAEVSTLCERLPPEQRPADGEALAKLLIRQGKLTKYQAQAVYSGKHQNLVFGEYVVLDKLGAGGMGVVLKAQHRRMKRTVAIKVLPAATMKNQAAIDRFYREVEAAAKLNHPNIVHAYDASEHQGMHFLVMEYVDGRDLSAILAETGPLPVGQAVDYILQAARGLEFAHARGVVHRDIKPANLLLGSEGQIKILDMGLARLSESPGVADVTAAAQLTQSGQVMGTVDYMAPEQAADTRTADHRADIYALGCTLYKLLSGKPVYEADTMVKRLMAHQQAPIPSLRATRLDVPEALDDIFQQMVAKRPEDRYQSMTEVIAALSVLRQGTSSSLSVDTTGVKSAGSSVRTTSRPTIAAAEETVTRQLDNTNPAVAASDAPQSPGTAGVGSASALSPRSLKTRWLALSGLGVVCLAFVAWYFLAKGANTNTNTNNNTDIDLRRPLSSKQPLQEIDLISMWTDADRVAVPNYTGQNTWTRPNPRTLIYTSDGKAGKVMFPISLNSATHYAIEATVRRVGAGTLPFTWDILSVHPSAPDASKQTGIDFRIKDRLEITVAKGKRETIGAWPAGGVEPLHVVLEVHRGAEDDEVFVRINNIETARWKGSLLKIGIPAEFNPRYPGQSLPSIFCRQDSYEFTDLTLKVYEGEAKILSAAAKQASLQPGTKPGDEWSGNGLAMKFCWCPPGTFSMGSPASESGHRDDQTQHPVTLTRGFWLGKYEITQGEWKSVMGTQPWSGQEHVKEGKDHAATYLTWDDATEFCRKLTEQERRAGRLPEDKQYALPTEAQWEYACRAGTKTPFHFGGDAESLRSYAWFKKNAWAVNEKYPHEVGRKRPSEWGLHDMHGNVWEWCQDSYRKDYEKLEAVDPVNLVAGSSRVIRGGGWNNNVPTDCSSANRACTEPTRRGDYLGFRVAAVQVGQSSAAQLSTGERPGQEWSGNGLAMKFCWCPPGEFKMGEGADVVDVKLTRGFWLGKYEVTQGEYQKVMKTNPSHFSAGGAGEGAVAGLQTDKFPVERVTRDEATEFCRKLTEQEIAADRLPTGWAYTLPTDAQWECACRAGTQTIYSFGTEKSRLPDFAWDDANSEGHPHEAGQKLANPWGLHDMHGNVWEWCRDWYQEKLPGGSDPEIVKEASNRVIRGGSWYDDGGGCRSANRTKYDPAKGHVNLGFRVAAVQVSK